MSVVRHVERSHLTGKIYTCEVCDKSFKDKQTYRNHKFTHKDIKPFKCEYCGKDFIKQDKYRLHLKTSHAPQWEGVKAKIALEKRHIHETSTFKRKYPATFPDMIEKQVYERHRRELQEWILAYGKTVGYAEGFSYGRTDDSLNWCTDKDHGYGGLASLPKKNTQQMIQDIAKNLGPDIVEAEVGQFG